MKRVCFLFFLLILLVPFMLYGQNFSFSRDNVNISLPNGWQIDTPSGNSNIIFTLFKLDIASITISSVEISHPITIQGFNQLRQSSIYSGWENKGERLGSIAETIRANADSSYVSVYFVRRGQTERQIAAEYLFIKGQRGYVVTIQTKERYWRLITSDIKPFLESFWLGSGPRLFTFLGDSNDANWRMVGKNSMNENSVDISSFKVSQYRVKWDFLSDIRGSNKIPHILPVEDNMRIFFNLDNTLLCLSCLDGSVVWSNKIKGDASHQLLIHQDILYLITSGNVNSLYAFFSKNGNILFKKTLPAQQYSYPIAYKDYLFLVSDLGLSALEVDTGNQLWISNLAYNPLFYPVVGQGVVLGVARNNVLVGMDVHSGKVLYQKPFSDRILYSPIIVKHTAILTTVSSGARPIYTICALDLETGKDIWRYSNPNNISEISKMPSYVNNRLVVIAESENEFRNRVLLISLNPSDGKLISQFVIPDSAGYLLNQAVVSPESIYFLRTLDQIKVISKKKELNNESPVASEFVEKQQETNTYLIQVDLLTGKIVQTLLIKNKKYDDDNILSFNMYQAGILLMQGDYFSHHIKISYLYSR